ncbi:hypothetical protein CS378_11555 [Rhodococcus ruber]|nr:hypothetical protein CS378_11555 [Rhodococcus ruber]
MCLTGRKNADDRAEGAPTSRGAVAITDRDGLQLTAFVTNTRNRQLPNLELRHRRRSRYEDRSRAVKVIGLQNLSLRSFDRNRIWLAIVQLACELVAWTPMLGLTGHPGRCWNRNACGCGFGRSQEEHPPRPPHRGQPRRSGTVGRGAHRGVSPTRRSARAGLTSKNRTLEAKK